MMQPGFAWSPQSAADSDFEKEIVVAKKQVMKYPHPCKTVAWPKGNDEGGRVADYNPISLKPTDANQMAPTDAVPVRRRFQAAGGC